MVMVPLTEFLAVEYFPTKCVPPTRQVLALAPYKTNTQKGTLNGQNGALDQENSERYSAFVPVPSSITGAFPSGEVIMKLLTSYSTKYLRSGANDSVLGYVSVWLSPPMAPDC
jgi:hypothetical protein